MPRIRVLIVDDSVVIRRLLTDCLAGDPEIEVAGTAASGKIGLAKITQVNPDVVTLDLEMPEMDGIQTLIELRKQYPKLPVIMFSTLTERGAASTLDALTHGASDYVTKPANVGSVQTALQRVREQLIPKIKALCPRHAPEPPPRVRATATTVGAVSPGGVKKISPPRSAGPREVEVVTIGVSTGGPNALAAVMAALPADLRVPIVVVQHMPPMFTKLLADRLSAGSPLTIREAAGGETLAPGEVWIAPGDHHMAVTRTPAGVKLKLDQGPPENSCRPAVDVLFRSVAETYGPSAVAVVLTGMGQDGLIGASWIKERGGTVLAQDEPSSVVWGMPGYVVRAGLADRVLPLGEVARTIVALSACRPAAAAGRAVVA
jgi:two-component system chemotaxis response regulator CheB